MKCLITTCSVILLILSGCSKDELTNPHDPEYNPSTPKNLRLTQTNAAEVTLEWENADPNLGVRIERRIREGLYEDVAVTGEQTSRYVDSSVSANTVYFYRLQAKGHKTSSGYAQDSISVVFKSPEHLVLTQDSETSIRLSWQDNSRFELGFRVERRVDEQEFSEIGLVPSNDTVFYDDDVRFGEHYHYRVYAFGRNALTNAIEDSILHVLEAPGEPEIHSISENAIELYWHYASSLQEGFVVERSTNSSAWTEITRLAADVTICSDPDLNPGNTYSYRIAAFTSQSQSDYSPGMTIRAFNWAPQEIDTNVDLLSVYFVDENKGWISGSWLIFKTTDGGSNWESWPVSYPCGDGGICYPSIEIERFFADGIGWATTGYEEVLKTTNGGVTWQAFHIGDKELIRNAHVYDENRIWVLTRLNSGSASLGQVYYSHNGGQSWESRALVTDTYEYLQDVCFFTSSVGIVCGLRAIWQTRDAGRSWSKKYEYAFPGISNLYCVSCFPDSPIGLAFGESGYLKSTNSGDSWSQNNLHLSQVGSLITFVDVNTGWLVSSGSVVFQTNDGGNTWIQQETPPVQAAMTGIFFLNPELGWIIGENGLVLKYGGLHWVKI